MGGNCCVTHPIVALCVSAKRVLQRHSGLGLVLPITGGLAVWRTLAGATCAAHGRRCTRAALHTGVPFKEAAHNGGHAAVAAAAHDHMALLCG